MKIKLALCAALAALASGCAGVPTWDTNVFPEQPVYGDVGTSAPGLVALAGGE